MATDPINLSRTVDEALALFDTRVPTLSDGMLVDAGRLLAREVRQLRNPPSAWGPPTVDGPHWVLCAPPNPRPWNNEVCWRLAVAEDRHLWFTSPSDQNVPFEDVNILRHVPLSAPAAQP